MATFTVTTLADSGAGSLREAIAQANASAGADTIEFATSLTSGTISLTSGTLLISDDLTITGLGAGSLTVNAGGQSRVFQISNSNAALTVNLSGLTVSGGATTDSGDGAGILNQETLVLRDMILAQNQSADDGGAIANGGTLLLFNSILHSNTSAGLSETSGGGALINFANATTAIVDSTFYSNVARVGGAIRNDGILTIANSTISTNTALTAGGGIANSSEPDPFGTVDYAGRLTIRNSTITANVAQGLDGDNQPISGQNGFGGGVANLADDSAGGFFNAANTIIAGNFNNAAGADDIDDSVTFLLDVGNGFLIPYTVSGRTISEGSNLIGSGDQSTAFRNGQNGDLVGTAAAPLNPGLGSLQVAAGSFTPTHALQVGSPAVDAGNNARLPLDRPDQNGNNNTNEQLPFDQTRQSDRIIGSSVDIGAVELTIPPLATDFSGDQYTDIVWRNQITGEIGIWVMNQAGTARLQPAPTTPQFEANTHWEIQGIGDLTGDNRPDFVWRNRATGENAVWEMNGFSRGSASPFLQPELDTRWDIQGTGDFNGDGQTDLFWRNQATGENAIWLMSGTTRIGGLFVQTEADLNWQVGGVGDCDGDGQSDDLVWRNQATGENVVWVLEPDPSNGSQLRPAASSRFLTIETDLNWAIQGVSDLDNDGQDDDILWRREATGENATWFNLAKGGAFLLEVPGSSGWSSIV